MDYSTAKPEEIPRVARNPSVNPAREEPIVLEVLDLSVKKPNSTNDGNVHYNYGVHPPLTSSQSVNSDTTRSFMITPPSDSESQKDFQAIFNANIAAPALPVQPPGYIIPNEIHDSVRLMQMASVVSTATHNFAMNNNVVDSSLMVPRGVAAVETPKRTTRPFKAYPKDPLTLSVGQLSAIYDQDSAEDYNVFRKRLLDSVKSAEGTNAKMRRTTRTTTPGTGGCSIPPSVTDEKDAAYWERRRKNNEAAKRSRDARRAKEDEIAIRAAFLEQENVRLKCEVVTLRSEAAQLRSMVRPL